jgi:hypothetical protein
MSNLLILYEIALKASKVTSKTALRAYEKWVYQTIKQYQDAAIEHAARIQLFRLKEQYSM